MASEIQPVVELCDQYRNQFVTTVEHLRRRVEALGDQMKALAEQAPTMVESTRAQVVEPLVEHLKTAVTDMSPPPEQSSRFLLETYLWTAVCLLGLSVGRLLGGVVLSPLFEALFETRFVLAMCYVLLPVYAYYRCRKDGLLSDDDRRMFLFGVSVVLGLCSGYLLADKALPVPAPPAFLLAAAIGCGAAVLGSKTAADRRMFLGATVGLGAAMLLLFGLPLGGLASAPYLLIMVVLSGAAMVHLQLLLADMRSNAANMISAQLLAIIGALLIGDLLLHAFGMTHEDASAAANAAAHSD